jgi:hypothetical protein
VASPRLQHTHPKVQQQHQPHAEEQQQGYRGANGKGNQEGVGYGDELVVQGESLGSGNKVATCTNKCHGHILKA